MAPPENETGVTQHELGAEGVRLELAHHTDQLTRLWDETTKQSRQLAKLEEVPGKLDRLLDMNVALATLQQQQGTHGQQLKDLSEKVELHGQKIHGSERKFSYYAGALAVAGLIFGLVCWAGEQAVTASFSELASIHGSIQDLQTQIRLLQAHQPKE